MRKEPHPPEVRHDCLHLAARAAERLKAAGFVLVCASMKSEAVYYRLEGRHGVLRIATHASRREPIGMEHVCATLTFKGGKRDRGTLVCNDSRFDTMVWMAVGQYIMRSAAPHETRYKRASAPVPPDGRAALACRNACNDGMTDDVQ